MQIINIKRNTGKCYTCKHRDSAGSNTVHSKCVHPTVDLILSDHELLGRLFLNLTKMNDTLPEVWGLEVKLNPDAILNGWGYWPFNFDPIWVEKCTGYKKEEVIRGIGVELLEDES